MRKFCLICAFVLGCCGGVVAAGAASSDSVAVASSDRIPMVEIDGQQLPIYLKYTEFLGEETIKRGMYLTQLSRKWYGGEQAFWVYIYEANMLQIEHPDNIELGTVVLIPKLDPAIIDANNPECIRVANELKEKYLKKNQ